MFKMIKYTQGTKRKISSIRYLTPMFLVLCLFIFAPFLVYAGTALSTDKLVQCSSSGVITNNTAITGVNLPVQFDTTANYSAVSVDVAIYSGSTLVKELNGFATTNLNIGLGAVTNYDFDATNPVVYEIKYRGHYAVVGEGGLEITEDWQSSGLYFRVARNSSTATAVVLQSATADGATDTTTSTKIDMVFDTAITGLTADHITITNGTGAAVKGALTGSGTSWSIALTSVTAQGNVSVAVTAPAGYTLTGSPKTVAIAVAGSQAPTYALTITAGSGGSITTGSGGNYAAGTVINIAAAPNSGYSFNKWTSTEGIFSNENSAVTTFTMPAKAAAITASFTYNGSGNSGNSGGTPTATPPPSPQPATITDTPLTGNTPPAVTSTTATEAKSDSSGKAAAAVTESQVTEAVNKAVEAAAKKGEDTQANIEIKVTAPADAKSVETSLPKAAVKAMSDGKINALTVSTPIAAITFDDKALGTISDAAAGDVKITASKVDASALSEETKQAIGDRPVFNFTVTSGDNTISKFGGNVTVAVPYTLKADEDPNAVVIYYINAEGKLETVSNCTYDPATGTISFKTNHFSRYAVGYNKVSFTDVAANAWYGKAVGFVAARGITTGTGNGNYSPDDHLTRGQFLVMVMRAYDITPDENAKDNFADAGNTYYTGYLAAAKRMGITNGIGDNKYAPDKEITRQEMFTLLYNTLKLMGELPTGTNGKALTAFADADQIAPWAKDAMTLFVETEIIGGSGGRIAPADTTNRAQMAQVLYKLLAK